MDECETGFGSPKRTAFADGAADGSCGGSCLRKRSVMIAGHRTSVSLEDAFWVALREIAERRGQSLQAVIGAVDAGRGGHNLSSAIRVFVLAAYRAD